MKLFTLSSHDDWLMRPVLRGLCRFESLKDGTLTLGDVAMMNEAIDIEEANKTIIHRVLTGGG